MTIDIVFFDAGETLLRPYPSFPELFARTCRDEGYDVSSDAVERLEAHRIVELAAESGIPEPSLSADASHRFWSFLYRRFLADLGIDDADLVARLYEVFSDAASYRLFDDVAPALDELEAGGYRLGVISNFEGWLEKMLVEMEIGHRFDVTVISGIAGVEKPDPAIYRIAIEKAGVEPARSVHVGDSLRTDVEPAASVGINAVLLDRYARYPDATGHVVSSLEEIPALVSKL